jgi:hypothetical protein
VNPNFEMIAVPSPTSKSYFRYFGGHPFLISSMLGVSAIGFDYAFVLRYGNLKNRNNCNYCIQKLFVSFMSGFGNPGYECAWKHDFFVLQKVYIVELENESGISLFIK